jgi:hypothetical protein
MFTYFPFLYPILLAEKLEDMRGDISNFMGGANNSSFQPIAKRPPFYLSINTLALQIAILLALS